MITLISNKIRQNKNICTYLSFFIVTLLRLPAKLLCSKLIKVIQMDVCCLGFGDVPKFTYCPKHG